MLLVAAGSALHNNECVWARAHWRMNARTNVHVVALGAACFASCHGRPQDVISYSLKQRDRITELGDSVVRSLEQRIIEIVSIKLQQECLLRSDSGILSIRRRLYWADAGYRLAGSNK